jgi:hypothetical protein
MYMDSVYSVHSESYNPPSYRFFNSLPLLTGCTTKYKPSLSDHQFCIPPIQSCWDYNCTNSFHQLSSNAHAICVTKYCHTILAGFPTLSLFVQGVLHKRDPTSHVLYRTPHDEKGGGGQLPQGRHAKHCVHTHRNAYHWFSHATTKHIEFL